MRGLKAALFSCAVLCLCLMFGNIRAEAGGSYAPYSGSLAYAIEESGARVELSDIIDAAPADMDAAMEAEQRLSFRDKGYTNIDLKYLAAIIYSESNGMTYDALLAVGNVVLNRMYDSKNWPHVTTIRQVIYDDKWGVQFTPTKKNSKGVSLMGKALRLCRLMDASEYKEWQLTDMYRCIKAARDVLQGAKSIPDTYEYFNAHIDTTIDRCITNGWSFVVYDGHIYYRREE